MDQEARGKFLIATGTLFASCVAEAQQGLIPPALLLRADRVID